MSGDRAGDYQELRRIGRRRLWKLIGALTLIAALVALGLVAYYSPLLSVRNVDVTQSNVQGAPLVPREEIVTTADVAQGTPLLQVDTAAVADRVARIPGIESVTVERSYPSTLMIDVLERRATALIEEPGGAIGVVDRHGVVYARFDSRAAMGQAPARDRPYKALPVLTVPNPGTQDPTTRAALDAVQSLPDWLRPQVESVSATSPNDITFGLTKSRTVVWGDAEDSVEKAEALKHVLKLQGKTFNVSAPEFPAVS